MIQVTLTFSTIAAAAAALASMGADVHLGAISGPVQTPQAAAGNVTPAPTPAPTAAPVAAAPPAEVSAPTASTEKGAESSAKGDTAAALSYEKDVKPIVIKVGAAGKRDALVDLLKKFGVAKGPEVPADKLPAFKAELEALVA